MKILPAVLLALAVAAAAGLAATPAGTRAQAPFEIREDPEVHGAAPSPATAGITVRFKEGVPRIQMRRVAAAAGGEVAAQFFRSRGVELKAQAGALGDVLARLRASPYVEEAGVTRTAVLLDAPDDPAFRYQWHLRSTEGGMWADTAWDLAPRRGAGVVVAVIDTGVAYEEHTGFVQGYRQTFHTAPDLAGTTFVYPWDFTANEPHANDDHGHGTHVAATIAQDTGNGLGAAGVADGAAIMPLKALDWSGNGTEGAVTEAIYWAVDHGADVINMSLGWPGCGAPNANGEVCTEIVGLNDALEYAYSHGVTVVAAAGNDGGDTVLCPAAHPTVIAVGATRYDGTAAAYSNRGAALDLAAPGGDPSADQNGDGYADGVLQETFCYDPLVMLVLDRYDAFCQVFKAGTSMASPHVAGTAALLLGEDGSLTPDEVRALLVSTARDRGAPGRDDVYGAGILDAAGALAALKGVPRPTPTPAPGLDAPSGLTATAVSSSQINLAWTDNSSVEEGFAVERSTDGAAFSQVARVAAGVTSYSSTGLAPGTTYYLRVRAVTALDSSGYSNVASATTFPPPAAPSDLVATAVSSSRIDLRWTDNSTNEQGFKLERSADGGATWLIAGYLGPNVTTASNVNLAASTTYLYRIRAYEGTVHSAYSNTAAATTLPPPEAPSNLVATAVSSSRVDLTWSDNSAGEQGFKIERSADGGATWSQVLVAGANATSAANTNLAAGTQYLYRVRAYDGPNNSAYSNVASATTFAPPAAPSGLTATAVSSSRIDLRWTDNSGYEQGFRIERSVDGGATFTTLGYALPNSTSYSNTSLSPGTTYHYRVVAYDGPNSSPYSNVASATTPAAPAAPTNAAAAAQSSSRIALTWTDNSANEQGFSIERSADGASWALVATVGANVTAWTNTMLPAGATYYYRVRAYEGSNYSAYSNTASATTLAPPPAPSSLTASSTLAGRADLRWTDNSSYEQGFRVERSTDGVSWTLVATLPANTTSYSNGGLVSGATYQYRVRAYDGPNQSAPSNTATVTVK